MMNLDTLEACAQGRTASLYLCDRLPGEYGKEMPTWGDLLELVRAHRGAQQEIERLRNGLRNASDVGLTSISWSWTSRREKASP